MNTIRLRIELNKGRVGMPLAKLSRVCGETVKFLSMLAEDVGFSADKSSWLAEDFENGSVVFDLRCTQALPYDTAILGRVILENILSGSNDLDPVSMRVRPETLNQFEAITHVFDADETARIGVYKNGEARPSSWHEVGRTSANAMAEGVSDRRSYGEIQAVVNAFFKEHSPPYLRMRELSTGTLVKCFFEPEMYKSAVELLADRDAVVFVEGWVTENVTSGHIHTIEVQDFRPAPEFDEAKLTEGFGSIPNYTEGLTSDEYLELIRQ